MPLLPGIPDVLSNVIASAIVSVASWSVRTSRDIYVEAATRDQSVELSVREAVGEALLELGDVERIAPELGGESFRQYLRSPDLFTLIERLTVARITGDDSGTEDLGRELAATWAVWVARPAVDIAPHADRLLRRLIRAIDAGITKAVDCGVFDWNESRTAFRHSVMVHLLRSIERRIEFLGTIADVADFHTFERNYRDAIRRRASRITPPHVDDANRVRLDAIYVDPDFETKLGRSWQPQRWPLEPIRASLFRAVLLGQPGGGKSTFTQKLSSDLSAHYEDGLVGGVPLTPVPIVLRDYALAMSDRPTSIIDFVEDHARTNLGLTVPTGAIEYMFQQGRALVIFDGLDEIVSPPRRRDMRDVLESFSESYPATRVLVTSREIGYEQAPLDEADFESLRLAEFSDDQVAKYASNWFAVQPELSVAERARQGDAFLRESELVTPDLRRNPLLLALMCNLYKGEGHLPNNRPEIYKQCSAMLLRKWDAIRGIEVARPLGAHLERTLQHVAHWMFMQPTRQTGVPEPDLVTVAAQYLTGTRFEDSEEAVAEAQSFLEFCKGRAWVLVKVGTQGSNTLFQFAHRTFLEYFTAEYLVRTSDKPSDLGDTLLPKLGHARWDAVAQLALQIQNTYREGAADELLAQFLLYAARGRQPAHVRVLMFTVRALQFLVPTPAVTRRVVAAALDRAVQTGVSNPGGRGRHSSPAADGQSIVGALASMSVENIAVAARASRGVLSRRLGDGKRLEAAVAAAIAFELPDQVRSPTSRAAWLEAQSELWLDHEARILELAAGDPVLAYELLGKRRVALTDVLTWHGTEWLFADIRTHLGAEGLSYGLTLAMWSTQPFTRAEWPSDDLRICGEVLPKCDLPWIPGRWMLRHGLFAFRFPFPGDGEKKRYHRDVTFGAFCVLTPFAQMSSPRRLRTGPASLVAPLLEARQSRAPERGPLEELMRGLGWSEERERFAMRWIRRQASAIGRAPEP